MFDSTIKIWEYVIISFKGEHNEAFRKMFIYIQVLVITNKYLFDIHEYKCNDGHKQYKKDWHTVITHVNVKLKNIIPICLNIFHIIVCINILTVSNSIKKNAILESVVLCHIEAIFRKN